MVHSLRNCQKCPSWCGSVTCLLKHLRLPSMYQVFVDTHTRFNIKRAHLEGLKESSESRVRIPFCLSRTIKKKTFSTKQSTSGLVFQFGIPQGVSVPFIAIPCDLLSVLNFISLPITHLSNTSALLYSLFLLCICCPSLFVGV